MAKKKAMNLPVSIRRNWVESNPDYSIRRQCRLACISRSNFYYEPVPESKENLLLMRLIDEQYMRHPEYGSPRMTDWLCDEGYVVNHKRIARLMRIMGIQAITPGPHTSKPSPEHKIYPYLLRGVEILRPNHVWSADITYIPMRKGYMYLMAIIDWFSRFVLAWELSNSLESSFCISALERALQQHASPEIFNTDQGAQFTSNDFTDILHSEDIAISMDGRGRALDNAFIERLWWTVKYEEIYPKEYTTGKTLYDGLSSYFRYYNEERKHSALDKRTPRHIMFS
jgi:putative transposase